MRTHNPALETLNITEVKSRLNSLVNDIYRQHMRIVVEKSGIPVAGIVPIEDLHRLARLDEIDREAREILESIRSRFDDVPDEEIERQTERIMAEIKVENRAAEQTVSRSIGGGYPFSVPTTA